MDREHNVEHLDSFLRLMPVFVKRLGESFHAQDDPGRRFTHAQFRVLMLASSRDHWRMSDLAHRMALSPGSLTLMMDRLIEDGLISRGRSETDRRVVIVRITEKGREMLAQRRRGLHRAAADLIARLPADEQDELSAALGAVVRFLERHVSEQPGGPPS
jgi:DNA-binding MarR family transcriptional regulator